MFNKGKRFKKKTMLDKAIIVVLAIAIVAVSFVGIKYIEKQKQKRILLTQQQELDDKLQKAKEQEEKDKLKLEEEKKKSIENQCKEVLSVFKEKNQDVIGVIEIPGTVIKYPVLQSTDNEYYLDKDIDKNKSVYGSIYLDCKNNKDFSDKNSVIYGHNMKDGSMFGELKKFRDEGFLKNNQIIRVYTEKEIIEYRIFSVHVAEADYPYRVKKFEDDKSYESFLQQIINKSMINIIEKNIGENPTINDSIITLSTCAYDFDDARLAIHAKRVTEE